MGLTKEGKVAVLTNYREDQGHQAVGAQSRGVIVNSWLTAPPEQRQSTRDFVDDLIKSITATKVGGFSLVCGYLNEPLAIVSNRSSNMEQIPWVATEPDQTLGLSNTSFDDRSWPKILDGERLMKEAIGDHVQAGEDEDGLIARLLQVLSRDTLPRLPENATGATDTYGPYLRNSIFIPVIGAKRTRGEVDGVSDPCVDYQAPVDNQTSEYQLDPTYTQGAYGTQKQTVLLVRDDMRVRYFERTLYDHDANAIPVGKGDLSFEFTIGQ